MTRTTSFVSPRLLMIGGGAVGKLAEVLGQFGLSKPLVVTATDRKVPADGSDINQTIVDALGTVTVTRT